VLGWAVVALLVVVPMNWIALAVDGKWGSWLSLVGAVASSWGLAGAGVLAMVRTSRSNRRREAALQQRLTDAREAPLEAVVPAVARLKPQETAYVAVRAELKALQTVGFQAGTSGMSVRVAKGVTVRTAGTRGGAIREVVTVANGELVLTDQRVIFAGDAKSLSLSLRSIINVTYYNDGLGVNDAKASHSFAILDPLDAARAHGVAARLLQGGPVAEDGRAA
jgi:hypothetical protein